METFKQQDEDYDEDDEEAEDEGANEPEQEIGPPLLTSLAEDVEITGLPAWSTAKVWNLGHDLVVVVFGISVSNFAYALEQWLNAHPTLDLRHQIEPLAGRRRLLQRPPI